MVHFGAAQYAGAMTSRALVLALAATLSVAAACSSEFDDDGAPREPRVTGDTSDAGTGETPTDPATPGDDDSGAPEPDAAPARPCGAPANSASEITRTRVAQARPNGTLGGAIAEGTYHLTKHETFTGVGGAAGARDKIKETLVVKGTTMFWTRQISGDLASPLGPETYASATFTATGPMLTVSVTCSSEKDGGPGDTENETFDVQGTTLVRYGTDPRIQVQTFEKQP